MEELGFWIGNVNMSNIVLKLKLSSAHKSLQKQESHA